MFSSLGWPEIAVLILVALFIFGPDRLPGAAKQAGEALRGLRKQVTGAKKQIKEELGDSIPEFDRDILRPKEFLRKHIWDDDETDNEPSGQGASVVSKGPASPAHFDAEAT